MKVVAGASRTRIAGRHGEGIRVQVAAIAERGKANEAVVRLLADALGVGTAQVELISGPTQPHKVFRIHGIDQQELDRRIAAFY